MARNTANAFAAGLFAERNMEGNGPRFHLRDDPFELSERQFISLYRLDKDATDDIIDIVEQYHPQRRSSALDASVQVGYVLFVDYIMSLIIFLR